MSKTELINIVNSLYDKYENNEDIFCKFKQIVETLPDTLEQTNNTLIEKNERKQKLEKGSDQFIQKFLHNNKIYYHTTSELFFEYKDNKYSLVKEDDVQHIILTNISENQNLSAWKHKIKITILKKIKERDIFTCIPESKTIQNVLNRLCPSICYNKEQAKYFLTIIGDILLKKSNLIYILNPKIKPFLKEINNLACILFGSPTLWNIFKFKYYEHKLEECRIINLPEYNNIDNWNDYFKQDNALDLFCVAAYYSNRYENADTFLSENCKDDALKTYTYYLKNNTEDSIVDIFINTTTEKSEDCSITWKNLQYLWKHFIDTEKIPNIFFTNVLKAKLIEKMKYDQERDMFLDCTSKLLPIVSKFINFWNEEIILNIDEDENEELEIDELCTMFASHSKTNISEKTTLDLIKHYYTDTFIEEDKYLLNIKCKLWNKKDDIITTLQKYKKILNNANNPNKKDKHAESDNINTCEDHDDKLDDGDNSNVDEIPINELYQAYCKNKNKSKNKFIVSKQYFERFIKEESQLYVVNDFVAVKSFDNISI